MFTPMGIPSLGSKRPDTSSSRTEATEDRTNILILFTLSVLPISRKIEKTAHELVQRSDRFILREIGAKRKYDRATDALDYGTSGSHRILGVLIEAVPNPLKFDFQGVKP
jgi:hypothetical protein